MLSASPAFADCTKDGKTVGEGSRLCDGGTVSVCSLQSWLVTTMVCKAPPAGQQAETIQSPPPPVSLALIHILRAWYQVNSTGKDMTYTVRDLCDGKQTCSFTDDARLMHGDPAPGQFGRFGVIYQCTNGVTASTNQDAYPPRTPITLDCRK